MPDLRGVGVAISVEAAALAVVRRHGATWVYDESEYTSFPPGEGIVASCRRVSDLWPVLSLDLGRETKWLAVRDPWGLVSGSGAGNKTNRDSRRILLLVGHVLGWAMASNVTPVLFESGELRRGFGIAVDADTRRLDACLNGMVHGYERDLPALSVEAVATAVMGGRHAMAPAALVKDKRI